MDLVRWVEMVIGFCNVGAAGGMSNGLTLVAHTFAPSSSHGKQLALPRNK